MAEKNLVIFIDSLPFYYIEKMAFLSQFSESIRKIVPGFGYSVNVKAEIFGGYGPDSAGYLNEWTYGPNHRLKKYHMFFVLLRPVKHFYYLDRVAHRFFSKLYGRNILNIPFEYLSCFVHRGTEAYRDEFPLPTIFSEMNNLRKICYYNYRYGKQRDHQIFADAMKAISSETHDNIFIASGDLDGAAHLYGVDSGEYSKKIEELDSCICQIYKEFTRNNPNGTFFVISDHGMADVTGSVHINMERQFSAANETTYLYFVDSTMLRVWTFCEIKNVEIEEFLNALDFGIVLDEKKRLDYAISSKEFGDIIFLLNEGIVFNPGFMGRRMPKSMHGYLPELESQKGILFTNKCLNKPEYAAKEVFGILRQSLVPG